MSGDAEEPLPHQPTLAGPEAPRPAAVPGEAETDVLGTAAAGPAAVRGGAMRLGGFLVGALASALSAGLLFRHLGVEETGSYVLALTLAAIVASVSDLGLTGVGVREMSVRAPADREQIARDLLGLRITLTLLGGALVTAIAAIAYSATIAAGVALASAGLLIQVAQDNLGLTLIVELRLGWIAMLELGRQLLTTSFVVVLVVLGASLLPFIAVGIPVSAILLGVAYVLVRGRRTLTPSFSLRRWHAFSRAMLPYALAAAASALYFRISVLVVSALASSQQSGYFNASFRVIEVLTVVPGLLVGSAFPIFARAAHNDHERLGYALGRVSEAALLVGVWVGVSIAVGAPLVMAILGGPAFKDAAPILAIQGVALAAMFMSLVWANALLSLALFRAILIINLVMLALNAGLVAGLVSLDGARGAAIGTALAEIVGTLVQAAVVIRGRPHLRPSLAKVPYVAVAGALALVPIAMTGIPVIARLVISTAVYAAVVLLARAYPPELLDVVPWLAARRAPHGTGP